MSRWGRWIRLKAVRRSALKALRVPGLRVLVTRETKSLKVRATPCFELLRDVSA